MTGVDLELQRVSTLLGPGGAGTWVELDAEGATK